MDLYSKVYLGLLFITLVSYVTTYRENEKYSKWVILLMILWLFTSATAIYLSEYAGYKNNLFVFHISTPLEYAILGMLFRGVLVNATLKKILTLSIPSFIVLSILFAAFVQKPDANNSDVVIIESVILVFLSLFFLREVLLLQQVPDLHRFPMFWICVAILFYYIGNLIVEGMLNYMIRHSMELARRAYRVGSIFKYLLFILFIIGAYCNKFPRLLVKKNTL